MSKYRSVCLLMILIVLYFDINLVYAYSPPRKPIGAEYCGSFNDERLIYEHIKNNMNDLKLDGYFVDKTGKKYENEDMHRQACIHNYINGNYINHVKNGIGCVNYVYNSKICSICNGLIIGEFQYKMAYPICIH